MRVLIFLICCLTFGYSFASDGGANNLLVKILLAQKAYIESFDDLKKVGKLNEIQLTQEQAILSEINSTLDRIVEEHADSHLAVQILTNQDIGSLNVEGFRERYGAVTSEINKRACVDSVLTDCVIDRLVSIVQNEKGSVKPESLLEALNSLLTFGDGRYDEFVVEAFKNNAPYDERLSRSFGSYYFTPKLLMSTDIGDVSKYFQFDSNFERDKFHLRLADKLILLAKNEGTVDALAKREFQKIREPENLGIHTINSYIAVSGRLGVALPSEFNGELLIDIREKYPESLYLYYRLMGDDLAVLDLVDEINGSEAFKALGLISQYAANQEIEESEYLLIEKAVQKVLSHDNEYGRTLASQNLKSRLDRIKIGGYKEAISGLLEDLPVSDSSYIHIYGNRYELVGENPLEGAEEQIKAYWKKNRMIMPYEKMELSIVKLYQKTGATEKALKMLSGLYITNIEFIKDAYFIAYELKSDRLMKRYSDDLIQMAFKEVKTKNKLSNLIAALEVRYVQSCLAKGECQ